MMRETVVYSLGRSDMQKIPGEETHILGQAFGNYRERPVAPALRRHFASAWFHTKPPGPLRQTAVVPDASADLVWFGGTLIVAGPDCEASFESVPPGTTVVGLKFQPGAVARWLKAPAFEIVGERLKLGCFQATQAQQLLDSIGDAQSPELIVRRLEKTLSSMATHLEAPDPFYRTLIAFVGETRYANGPIIRDLTSTLGMSERTLRRRCEQGFGYGPKILDRILRMQRFLRLVSSQNGLSLTRLAGAVGYADQAHLTREARELTGLTPTTILAQLAPSNEHGAPVRSQTEWT
jgi:AraC-like DNA-binding protein